MIFLKLTDFNYFLIESKKFSVYLTTKIVFYMAMEKICLYKSVSYGTSMHGEDICILNTGSVFFCFCDTKSLNIQQNNNSILCLSLCDSWDILNIYSNWCVTNYSYCHAYDIFWIILLIIFKLSTVSPAAGTQALSQLQRVSKSGEHAIKIINTKNTLCAWPF